MNKNINMKVLFCISIFILNLQFASAQKTWFKAGSNSEDYEVGVVKDESSKSGEHAAYIFSKRKSIKGFGTYMQTCSAKDFLGKKIKMTGYIKTDEVKSWAGMWLRIDGKGEKQHALSFDNMGDRPLKGSMDWTLCEISLDVPKNAKSLNFGALLSGSGKIWFDAIQFEIIESISDMEEFPSLPQPQDLDFEESH